MAPQRYFRLITLLLFVSVTFLPACGQDAPLNGFDDYVSFEEQGKDAQKKTEAERVKDTRHSLAVAEYAGDYSFYCRSNSKKLTSS
jgi:hypothetical protein